MRRLMMILGWAILMCCGCGGGQMSQESAASPADETESSSVSTREASTASPDAEPSGAQGSADETESSPPATGGVSADSGGSSDDGASAGKPQAADAPSSSNSEEVKEASEARITDKHIVISGKVLFETGKAKLKKVSHEVLDEVVFALEKHPEIIKLQIVGHTDSDGDAKANKRLSARRATSVMKYLIKNGIERDRLLAVGVGEDKPIASNDTEEGKDKNRRVEFLIIERAKVTAVTHTASTMAPGEVKHRKATADETEELIKKEGLDKKF